MMIWSFVKTDFQEAEETVELEMTGLANSSDVTVSEKSFQMKANDGFPKVFLLISSLASPSSAGDWGHSRGCHSWPVQPNPAGWGGSKCALCSGSSHVRSYYITSYCIMANHIIPLHYMPQRFQGEIGSEMKEEEKEMKEINWGGFLTLNYQIEPCVLPSHSPLKSPYLQVPPTQETSYHWPLTNPEWKELSVNDLIAWFAKVWKTRIFLMSFVFYSE